MRIAASVRALAVSLALVLAACGGSSGKSPAGAAGSDGGGSAAGADGGAAGSGAGATDGAAGAAGGAAGAASGPAGADGGSAGVGGSAGSSIDSGPGDFHPVDASDAPSVADGSPDAGEGGSPDAAGEAAVPTGPCAAITIGAPAAVVSNVNNGKTIDVAAFTGGTLESGTYWLTSVSHFGGTSYAGTTQEILIVDATAKTVEDAYVAASGPVYRAFSYTGPTATTLAGTPICGTTSTLSATYTFTGTGPGATFSANASGTSDVKVFTKR